MPKKAQRTFRKQVVAQRVDPDWDSWFDAWRPLTIPERQSHPDA